MERKFKQVEIQRRISFSNEVNASRLKVLTARDEVVTAVKTVVIIRCRKSDVSVVQGAMADAAKTFKAAMGKECKVELDKEKLPEIKIMLFGRSATRTHCDTDM